MQDCIYEIDLHGISMSEAKMVLDEVFEYLHDLGQTGEVRIIVGVGKGSEMGPVLPAFVQNYLNGKGYRSTFKEGVIYLEYVQ